MAFFPERRIYMRSEGRVQFYTVGRGLQATVAGLLAIFLAWVSFSTVTVVFKDRIIAAEDHRFQASQAAFESQIAALQISYDGLVASAANAQVYADRQLVIFDNREQALVRQSDSFGDLSAQSAVSTPVEAGAVNSASGKPRGVFGRALYWLGLGRGNAHRPIHHPSLDRLAAETASLARLSRDSGQIMRAIEGGTLQRVADEKEIIAGTGINADGFLRKMEKVEGVGGPEVSLNTVQLDGVPDRDFSQAYFRAEANLGELADLRRAVTWLPTAMPLGSMIERTSGFGPRLDPFSGRYAFHPGIDFAGPTGTAVLATAGGLVTFAGRDGGYGNMVEIDHGYGLRTRYAHLLSVAVTKGQSVPKGAVVGRLGSTGRSTGPHVHYEVWYDDTVRNPDGFLRAGRLAGNNFAR
jgi:murein DD-endopeptidase MepM/ murein hydrolase activator NlpD